MDGQVADQVQTDSEEDAEEDKQEVFTFAMAAIFDLFRFDHAEAIRIAGQFRSNNEILQDLHDLQNVIQASDLDEDEKALLVGYIEEEMEVLSFSYLSRHSVIEL